MISNNESALICDLAETYQIYNYRSLPVKLVATLSVGLRENSRIKMEINGDKIPLDTSMLVLLLDSIHMLRWELSGAKGKKPESIYLKITETKKESDVMAFNSGEEFEEYRKQILERS